jgi:hypothetical protein
MLRWFCVFLGNGILLIPPAVVALCEGLSTDFEDIKSPGISLIGHESLPQAADLAYSLV